MPTAIAVEETKTEAPKGKQETAYESSEEEKTDLTLGDDQAMIKDRKEVEAERRKKQEQENGVGMGWRALESQTKEGQEQKGPTSASAKPSGKGEVKFGGGKPTFNRKVGVAGGRNDFPELGSVSQEFGVQKDSSAASKKDQANIGDFGNTGVARKPAEGEEARGSHVPFEERKPATKPVFTSSKKTKIGGGANLEEVQNSKQNYDFGKSGMMVSTATDKVAKPRVEGEEGYEERPKREYDGERPKREYDGERPKREYDGERPKREFDVERPKREYNADAPKREYNADAPKREYDGERPKREYNAPKRDFDDKDRAP